MGSLHSAVLASLLSGASLDAVRADDPTEDLITETQHLLDEIGVEAIVTGRLKSPQSILHKMEQKGLTYDEVMDRVALRICVEDEATAYAVMEELHHHFEPIPQTFDDYVQHPKDNGYQSLHTAVLTGIDGVATEPVEFQVRTHEMHEMAEAGPASHVLYKLSS
jgi:(p)ppGpp synthase/HD superfamily hydrolase